MPRHIHMPIRLKTGRPLLLRACADDSNLEPYALPYSPPDDKEGILHQACISMCGLPSGNDSASLPRRQYGRTWSPGHKESERQCLAHHREIYSPALASFYQDNPSLVSLLYHAPVHNLPERGQMIRPTVLIVQIVRMLPHIEGQQRLQTLLHRVRRIRLLRNQEFTILI